MSDSPETPQEPKPWLSKEYEDPHFHDEDDVTLTEEREQRHLARPAAPGQHKPTRRPPPPRRFYED